MKNNINAKDEYGRTALIWATVRDKIGFVKLLLDNGADVNIRDKNEWTALKIAEINGYRGIAKLLGGGTI